MALGGLIEVLAVPQSVDDGWGIQIDMTHRGYNVDAGVTYGAADRDASNQIIAAKVDAFLGKLIGGEFKAYSLLGQARFTVDEIKALGNGVTFLSLIAAAKTKIGLT